MILTKKMMREIEKTIRTYGNIVHEIILDFGTCDMGELDSVLNFMQSLWRKTVRNRDSVLRKNYYGIIRRTIIAYDAETQCLHVYFKLVGVLRNGTMNPKDLETLIKIYWVRILFLTEQVKGIGVSVRAVDDLVALLDDLHFCLCKINFILLPLDMKAMIRGILWRRKLITFHGIFHDLNVRAIRNVRNRHVTVER